MTYDEVIENCLWLESKGDFSRYSVPFWGLTIWVNDAEETIAGPDD